MFLCRRCTQRSTRHIRVCTQHTHTPSRTQASELLQSHAPGAPAPGASHAAGAPLAAPTADELRAALGRAGEEPASVDALMGALRQVLTSGQAKPTASDGGAVTSDDASDGELRPSTPDAPDEPGSATACAAAARRASGSSGGAAATEITSSETAPPGALPVVSADNIAAAAPARLAAGAPAARVVRLLAGGVEAACTGRAFGERKRRSANKDGKPLGLEGLEPEKYCKVVTLQCGGAQTISFGLGPGERKGDYARARLLPRPVRA